MNGHTPTPWKAHTDYVFKGNDCIVVCDTDNLPIETRKANAAFIVRAVNSHDGLIAALKEAREYFAERADAEYLTDGPVGNTEMALLVEIDAALAKAGA